MISIFIAYPGNSATRFDRAYYASHHLPLVMRSWRRYGLESLTAFYPEDQSEGTIALCLCVFRDDAAVTASFGSPEAEAVMKDVVNFTESTPVQSRAVPLAAGS